MEHPNMLPNGMPGPGQQMASMQRPQPGNGNQQLHAQIMNQVGSTAQVFAGKWQATIDPRERGNYIMQLVTSLRMLMADVAQCLKIALNFENSCLSSAPNKEMYQQNIKKKLGDIAEKRNQQQMMAANGMGNGMVNQGMQGMNMQNPAMSLGQMNGNQLGQAPGFPPQQQRMQPSPMPQQQPQQQQPPATNLMDASLQAQPQIPAQQNQNMQNQQTPNMSQQAQAALMQEITGAAQRLLTSMPEEKKSEMRNHLFRQMSEHQRSALAAGRRDPLQQWAFNRAKSQIFQQRAQNGQPLPGQHNQGVNGMQMAGMGNNQNLQQQSASGQTGGVFDFTTMLGQQANALKIQESGEQEVVPASNNVNMAFGNQMNTPQPQAAGVNQAMLGNNMQQGGNQPNQMTNPNQAQMQMMLMQQQQQQQRQRQERMNRQNLMAQQAAMQQVNQANQLRGQPGGLNAPNAANVANGLNGAAGGSPAMSMLNRPMQPPGSQAPNTPQQPAHQQGMQLNIPANNQQSGAQQANALMQHHQNMLNQNVGPNGQTGQPGQVANNMPQGNVANIMRQLPPAARQKLMSMPPQQAQQLLQKLIQQGAFQQANQQGQAQGLNGNNMNMNMNMGIPQMAQQQRSQMPAVAQNFDLPQQQQTQPNQMPANTDPTAQMQQRLQQQQQLNAVPAQIRTQAMWLRPFPRQILTQLGLSVPQHVNIWGHLRQHILQNAQILQPGINDRFMQAMGRWFEEHPEELQAGMRELMQQHQQKQQNGGQQPGQPGAAMNLPNGQAPPAQMVPPAAPMQAGPAAGLNMNLGQGQIRMPPSTQPTPHEIQVFRTKMPNAGQMSDDQIKQFIVQGRVKMMMQASQQAAQQQALRSAQLQNGVAGNVGVNPGAQPQSRTPAQSTPNQQLPPAQHLPQQQQIGQKRQQAGGNDEVMEIPNPNAPQIGNMPQMPNMVPNVNQQLRPPMISKEQLAKMSPDEKEAYIQRINALRNAQLGIQNKQQQRPAEATPTSAIPPQAANMDSKALFAPATAAEKEKLSRWWQEVRAETPKGQAARLDANALEQVKTLLRRLWKPLTSVDQTFPLAMRVFEERRIRDMIRAKILMLQNVADEQGTLREPLSITPSQLNQMSSIVSSYFMDIKRIREQKMAQLNGAAVAAGGQAQRASAAGVGAAKAQPPHQASSQQTGQTASSQQSHGRKASSSSRPPAAPTENKTFDWVAPQHSPHGVPKYEPGRQELTPDKLKFPPQKKRRTATTGGGQSQQPDSAASTPAQQVVTPGAIVAASPSVPGHKIPSSNSPEQMRKAAAKVEAEEREKRKWRCERDGMCEASIKGFESEEELKAHYEAAHQPVGDPLQFLLDSAASALGVDADGVPLSGSADAKAPVATMQQQQQTKIKTLPSTKPTIKREVGAGLGLGIKQEALTPATQVGTPATPAALVKGKGATPVISSKVGAIAEAEVEKPKTLREAMAEGMGFTPLISSSGTDDTAKLKQESDDLFLSSSDTAANPDNDLWLDIGDTLLSGLQDMDGLSANENIHIDDWGLRRPEDTLEPSSTLSLSSPGTTPSSVESGHSRSSDVSVNDRLRINLEWDPFGNGDTFVPEILRVGAIGLGDGKKEDAVMIDGDSDVKVDDKKADPTVNMGNEDQGQADKEAGNDLDWSGDLISWDAMFGPDAGLVDDNSGFNQHNFVF